MSFAEYMAKTPAQLKETLSQLAKEQMNLRFQKAAGQLKNVNRWREVRKLIATVQTAMSQLKKQGK